MERQKAGRVRRGAACGRPLVADRNPADLGGYRADVDRADRSAGSLLYGGIKGEVGNRERTALHQLLLGWTLLGDHVSAAFQQVHARTGESPGCPGDSKVRIFVVLALGLHEA